MFLCLSCACPETRARTTSDGGSLDLKRLVKIGLLYGMTLIAFFVLFQSDPGYLAVGIMKDWEDGATLEGSPCDFAAAEEEFENSHISETTTATMNQGGLAPRNRHAATTTLSARPPNSSLTNDNDQVGEHQEMDPLT